VHYFVKETCDWGKTDHTSDRGNRRTVSKGGLRKGGNSLFTLEHQGLNKHRGWSEMEGGMKTFEREKETVGMNGARSGGRRRSGKNRLFSNGGGVKRPPRKGPRTQ